MRADSCFLPLTGPLMGKSTRRTTVMRYLLLLIAVLLVSAPAAIAQDKDYGDWEFFIGYAHERANNGADRLDAKGVRILPSGATARVDFVSERRVPHNGVTGEVVANVHRNIGLVTNFSATFANVEFFDRLSGNTYDARLSRYNIVFCTPTFFCFFSL